MFKTVVTTYRVCILDVYCFVVYCLLYADIIVDLFEERTEGAICVSLSVIVLL